MDKYNSIPFINKLIYVESRNNPLALSHKGAVGLMQIMPSVVEDYNTFAGGEYTIDDMYKIKDNLKVGVWHLKRLRKYYENDIKAVSAYNMGFGNQNNNIYNLKYCIDILGRDRVYKYLEGKKTKAWKGKKSCYIVTD